MLITISSIIILVAGFWFYGNSGWHLNRNKFNKLPIGDLKHLKGPVYVDDVGHFWELLDQKKNIFHQPDHEVELIENPYPNVEGSFEMDTKNPNLKFLCKTDSGGSFEAILQPDGTYLTQGLKQGTYNYGHPEGLWGSFKHAILDVIPHFINSNYRSF
ncbi:MAG: hypothetical protein DWQ02_07545 [Bacteroidetes bacterium]|nr:MAG: hypothetical protein DWQ02_07545 [Bacteroidota bacterium]